jgi:hypothetical protein
MINQSYINVTRGQVVRVLKKGINVQKPSDKEVSFEEKVEYKIITRTSENSITEFICTLNRFNRLYVPYLENANFKF